MFTRLDDAMQETTFIKKWLAVCIYPLPSVLFHVRLFIRVGPLKSLHLLIWRFCLGRSKVRVESCAYLDQSP